MKKIAWPVTVLLVITLWHYATTPSLTVISVCIGHTFEQVAQASSFPVETSSDSPSTDGTDFRATWVTKPAVAIRFDDPRYGFTLPPTTFAAIAYMHNKVDNITTSPMLKKLSFDQTTAEMARLQNTFRMQGWELENDSTWFDLSNDGKKILRTDLLSAGNGKWIALKVPQKYSMFFGLHCVRDCSSRIGQDRYLIDISIGRDAGNPG